MSTTQTEKSKTAPQLKAGDAFAKGGRRGAPVKKDPGAGPNPRKLQQMKKVTDKPDRAADKTRRSGFVAVQTAIRPEQRELMPQDEWDALLQSIEAETGADEQSPAKVETAQDELWEKLSSTRWLKEPRPGEALDGDSTVRG